MSVKLMNGVLGLVAGVASIPVMIVVWPIMFAWWIANETDEDV